MKGKFLEALGSGIGTGSIFCLSFSLSNRVGSQTMITTGVRPKDQQALGSEARCCYSFYSCNICEVQCKQF